MGSHLHDQRNHTIDVLSRREAAPLSPSSETGSFVSRVPTPYLVPQRSPGAARAKSSSRQLSPYAESASHQPHDSQNTNNCLCNTNQRELDVPCSSHQRSTDLMSGDCEGAHSEKSFRITTTSCLWEHQSNKLSSIRAPISKSGLQYSHFKRAVHIQQFWHVLSLKSCHKIYVPQVLILFSLMMHCKFVCRNSLFMILIFWQCFLIKFFFFGILDNRVYAWQGFIQGRGVGLP